MSIASVHTETLCHLSVDFLCCWESAIQDYVTWQMVGAITTKRPTVRLIFLGLVTHIDITKLGHWLVSVIPDYLFNNKQYLTQRQYLSVIRPNRILRNLNFLEKYNKENYQEVIYSRNCHLSLGTNEVKHQSCPLAKHVTKWVIMSDKHGGSLINSADLSALLWQFVSNCREGQHTDEW